MYDVKWLLRKMTSSLDAVVKMKLFKQKASDSSRPLEWLWSGGRANREAAIRFLGQLSKDLASSPSEEYSPRLLAYRDDFRRLIKDDQEAVLQLYLQAVDPTMRSLAVWMLRFSANRCQLLGIEQLCDDPSPMVRKHVAKALYRLEARQQLREMAAQHPNDVAVQWIAKERPNAATFEQRLHRFSQQVDHSMVDEATKAEPMTFWARFEDWFLTPAKSRAMIRRILERIKHSIHGIR